jgi:hypothetical protein
MNKKLAICLIVLAFLVGTVGGFMVTNHFWKRFTNVFYSTALAAQTGTDVHLLSWLRSNNVTNTVDLLEIQLDGSVVGLGVYLQNLPESERDPTQVKILQQAKAYRSKFPHKSSSPLGDQMISNIFSSVEIENQNNK